ncbi:MAG: Holliday junction resolvase RuvX [Acidimicrobiales bacterium]
MSRVLGVDLGSKRIGLAISDDGRVLASAYQVLQRGRSRVADHAELARTVAESGATLVVVGLPLSLSGRSGPAARAVEAEVAELRQVLDVPVELCDERLTTVVASRSLEGRRPALRRAVIDQMAAAGILQTWLDRQRRAS